MAAPNADPYVSPESPARRGLVCRVVGVGGEVIDCSKPTPIDPSDVVMPDGWECDEDGRGLSVLEMQRVNAQSRAA